MTKGDGGAVGLTESPAALRRWIIAGPEIARAVNEFESAYEVRKPANTCHHEQVSSVQKAFAKDVQNLIEVIDEMGNPFREDSTDLLVLDTKEIVPKSVVEAVSTAKEKGQSMYDTYAEERLTKRSNAAISLNWKSFLRLDDSKKELFQYLAESVQSLEVSDVVVLSTADVDVVSSTTIDKTGPGTGVITCNALISSKMGSTY